VTPPMPPSVDTGEKLLLEQLGELLTVESTLAKLVLPHLAQTIMDDELKQLVQKHLSETKTHVENVKQAFEALGAEPQGKPAPGLDGLRAERDSKVEQIAPGLRAGFDCAAAMGTEHYEINLYDAAIRTATALGEGDVADLLRTNLTQETGALEQLAAQADRLAQQLQT
jgi:ferritin-like metal-binding protein YciE